MQNISYTQSVSSAQLTSGPEPAVSAVSVPDQGVFIAGSLSRHFNEWKQITDDYTSLNAINGVSLPLIGKPPTRQPSQEELGEERVDQVIDEALKVVVHRFRAASLIPLLKLGAAKSKRGPRSPQGRRSIPKPGLHSSQIGTRDRVRKEIHTQPQSKLS